VMRRMHACTEGVPPPPTPSLLSPSRGGAASQHSTATKHEGSPMAAAWQHMAAGLGHNVACTACTLCSGVV
jgi:hypothetical protein